MRRLASEVMYPVDDADADADGCAVDSSANARTGAADRVVYAATGHTGIGGGANLGAGTDDRACERDCDQRADCHLHRAGGHALTAMYLTARYYGQRGADIARYDNRWGVPRTDTAFPVIRLAREPRAQPQPEPEPQPAPEPQPQSPEKRERKPRVTVKLDTGGIIGATSLKNPYMTLAVQAYLADKRVVVTRSVLNEFMAGSYNVAGPREKILVALFFLRVDVIPDDASQRVMDLPTNPNRLRRIFGPVDKVAFGTGDQLNAKTISGDGTFAAEAERHNVILDVWTLPKPRYASQ